MIALDEPQAPPEPTDPPILQCLRCGSYSLFIRHEAAELEPGSFSLRCMQCGERLTSLPNDAVTKWLKREERSLHADSDRRLLRESVDAGYFPASFLVECGIDPRVLNWLIRSGREMRVRFKSGSAALFPGVVES